MVLAAPLVFPDGLRQIFLSSIWTLSYREIASRESLTGETATERPLPDAPVLARDASGLALERKPAPAGRPLS